MDWAGWPDTYDRVLLDEVDSTMAEAARRAPTLTTPTWILARSQTAGRGRRGRAWRNPWGNFAATLIYRPDGPPDQVALRSFVAALALYDALSKVVPPAKLSLKWPNDVLLGGGKVAGILLESTGVAGQVNWLSIGIGINLTQAPSMAEVEPGAVPPVAVAEFTTARLRPEGVLFELAVAFDALERSFATYGFEPIRNRWLAHAAKLGETITARVGSDNIVGVFDTVDAAGNLVLRTPRGPKAIAAAEVFF
ncbi:biotin--acetyl-CoA-carboxylase ligase [Actibacterium mucosum KCTC 23349]|uniref:biotin--[biotin carboxyl-carrier protein] ligase n=1 Tax=Actibacterium mucosum KCTC 23349 TaxID=1454373 RepID=A0A037ZIT8_9RHOB|nr:biotin--[acetyl-CoA-carboxylase] ligase [Actibacterium mucosum]KAJ55549.1 biotin--acetyl-CoA-carboxylase ligase [Actibacterium mucosum KCTC 23349]